MKNIQFSKERAPCNHENNPVLARWEQVAFTKKQEPAVFAHDGSVLRTFATIEEEAKVWTDRFTRLSTARVICLQIGNCAEWPAILLAAWRSGRTALPIERDMPQRRRKEIERLCGAGLWLDREETGLKLCPVEHSPAHPGLQSDLLKLTSGTTAEPRAIRFTGAQLLADCDNVCDTMGLREDDRNYGVISFAHSYGFSNLITPLLCRGIPLIAAMDVMPRALIEGFASSGATVFPGVPAIFRSLAEVSGGGNALRLCISAAARLEKEVAVKFFERWGRKVHSFYGASECGGICYDSNESPDVPPDYVGAPLKNVEVQMPEEGPAQIEVRSDAVGSGYYPDCADENLSAGMFRPSDLLVRNRDGYVITGRISDLINVGGRKVNPGDVERVLRLSAGVRDVVVLGIPASPRGEDVAACVAGEATEEELRKLCFRNLSPWQVPRRWFFLREIPLNARGKINRADLRSRLE
ncbi:MAG TPA: class I adenylate-forming enzyme family protein [Terrimicrobiaceae bacterium]